MLRFTEEHEWLKQDGDEVGRDHRVRRRAARRPRLRRAARGGPHRRQGRGDRGTIESVKAASDIAAPLDGQITEVNPAIVANPALVNEDPMEDGWFFKMTLEDPSELEGLMDEEAYREYIA